MPISTKKIQVNSDLKMAIIVMISIVLLYTAVLTEYVEPGVLPDGLVGAIGSDLPKKIYKS